MATENLEQEVGKLNSLETEEAKLKYIFSTPVLLQAFDEYARKKAYILESVEFIKECEKFLHMPVQSQAQIGKKNAKEEEIKERFVNAGSKQELNLGSSEKTKDLAEIQKLIYGMLVTDQHVSKFVDYLKSEKNIQFKKNDSSDNSLLPQPEVKKSLLQVVKEIKNKFLRTSIEENIDKQQITPKVTREKNQEDLKWVKGVVHKINQADKEDNLTYKNYLKITEGPPEGSPKRLTGIFSGSNIKKVFQNAGKRLSQSVEKRLSSRKSEIEVDLPSTDLTKAILPSTRKELEKLLKSKSEEGKIPESEEAKITGAISGNVPSHKKLLDEAGLNENKKETEIRIGKRNG